MAQQPNSCLNRIIVEVSRSYTNGHTHTHTRGRTPLNEWWARRTARKRHMRQTYISSAGFEPTIPEIERLKTSSLDRNPLIQQVHAHYIVWVCLPFIYLSFLGRKTESQTVYFKHHQLQSSDTQLKFFPKEVTSSKLILLCDCNCAVTQASAPHN